MTEQTKNETRHGSNDEARCPNCKNAVAAHQSHCPQCGYPLDPPTRSTPAAAVTNLLLRRPSTWPAMRDGQTRLAAEMVVVLQMLPSGACVTLSLTQPTVLGRSANPSDNHMIDLTPYNAIQHGVSRAHCRLEHREEKLLVTDLNSTNGTMLNDQPLLPHREHVVTHNDRLILGTLHVIVTFSRPPRLGEIQ